VSVRPSDASHHALVEASLTALDRVLKSGAASRDSAFDLLSSDAFITYAFEAAADEPEVVSARAEAAMRRISDRAVTFLDRTQS
jgi:hypothetical protein